MTKREFMMAGAGAGLALGNWSRAFAQAPKGGPKPTARKAKTTKLFKSPHGFPNGLAATPEGLWIAEQKLSGAQAASYKLPEPKSLDESCWLVDWNGKLVKTVKTPSRNTSGMAVGGGYIWMVANAPPQGVFQVDLNSKLISHRQIPLGMPGGDGGGSHGAHWEDGKLWISALRLRGNIRVDPKTWQPEMMIPFYQSFPDRVRYHDITIDNGSMWQVVGNDSKSYKEGKPGLVRYDLATGRAVETVDFVDGSSDPHGLAMHNGKLIACDAGIHPGWPNNDSPTAGWIFQIDFV
ncbi:MAG: hypothetical protein FJW40_21985 [Acidobacteria bacterium]|nr:hypothetical protein [Acidobacteriota bacterium]